MQKESYPITAMEVAHGERGDPRANMPSGANLVDYTYTHKNIRNMDTLCSDVCSISGSSWPEAVSYSKHDVCCLMCFSLFSVKIRWYPNALNRGWPEAVRVLARNRARGILPGPKPKLTPPESKRISNKGRGGEPRCHRASLASLRLNNRIQRATSGPCPSEL